MWRLLDRYLLIWLQLLTITLLICLSYIGQSYCTINAFLFSAMTTKSIYTKGNWQMEPDSQMLHFHPSIFDLSLLYLLQGCWRPSRLTGVHPEQLSGSLAAQHNWGCALYISVTATSSRTVSRLEGTRLWSETLSYLCVEADASSADLSERICDHILWHHTGTASLL